MYRNGTYCCVQNYLQKESYSIVIPVKTGIQNNYNILDPRLRGGDALKLLHGISETWYYNSDLVEIRKKYL